MGRCKIGLEDVSYLLALAGGLAAFFSPCVLPMMPIYLASLAGADVLDAQPNSITSFKALRHSIAFVAGFSLVFTSLGALSGLGGVIINPSDLWVRILSGGMLVIFGTYMLLSLRFPSLSFEKHLASQQNLRTGGYIRSFLSGAVFTLAWTPCISQCWEAYYPLHSEGKARSMVRLCWLFSLWVWAFHLYCWDCSFKRPYRSYIKSAATQLLYTVQVA